jgi:hypothetical protein
MTTHETYVAVAWGLALLGFATMVALAARRHATARRRLAALEPAGRRRTAEDSGRRSAKGEAA